MRSRASAVKFRETGQEVWANVTFGQLELITVLDLHQIQAERMRRHATGPPNPVVPSLRKYATSWRSE